jgi:hypothetical protein
VCDICFFISLGRGAKNLSAQAEDVDEEEEEEEAGEEAEEEEEEEEETEEQPSTAAASRNPVILRSAVLSTQPAAAAAVRIKRKALETGRDDDSAVEKKTAKTALRG